MDKNSFKMLEYAYDHNRIIDDFKMLEINDHCSPLENRILLIEECHYLKIIDNGIYAITLEGMAFVESKRELIHAQKISFRFSLASIIIALIAIIISVIALWQQVQSQTLSMSTKMILESFFL